MLPEITVTNLSTSKRRKELLLDKRCSLKMPGGRPSVYHDSICVSMCVCKSVEEWTVFLPPLPPVTFFRCSLLCVAINPPQNPTNILEAQESFFMPPPVYTYSLDLSLYSYFPLSACVSMPDLCIFITTASWPVLALLCSLKVFITASYTALFNGPEIKGVLVGNRFLL